MKKYLLFISAIVVAAACNKTTTLASYTAPVSKNFIVKTFAHTADTVNVGDTIYLNVAGTMYDTLGVYAYLSIASTASGSPSYTYGTASSPVKLTTVLGSANVTDVNPWTSTIRITGVTSAAKSKLTITGNFIYQLSLSSEGNGTASSVPDAGQTTKTIYVQP